MTKIKDNPIKIAQWTEKIDFATSRDPLGLANRVSQRLVHQLLFGITAIGNRARYYSYSLWSIHDVMSREKPVDYRELADGIYWRDSAFMAACLLHHKDDGYDLDGVIGKDKGSKYLAETSGKVDLSTIEHIESNSEGGFGLNYRGSLLNLDFFREAYYDDSQKEIIYEVSNQIAIRNMLELFENNITDTVFYQKYACSRKPVPRQVLEEFAERICICLLPEDSTPERELLRDILFERAKGYQPQESFRPDSLRLLLYCARKCSALNLPFSEKQFRTMIYYNEYLDQDNNSHPIQYDKGTDEIINRWRIFFIHHYFSCSLEGIFVVLLNMLQESVDTGQTLDQIIQSLQDEDIAGAIEEFSGCEHIDVDKTTIGEFIRKTLGEQLFEESSPWKILKIENTANEENLLNHLRTSIRSSHVDATARCVITLIMLLERCSRLEKSKYWGWSINASKGDYTRSISAPIMYLYLKQHKENWHDFTLKELIRIIFSRFVIEQHELMVPEKTSGVSWLTYDDGYLFYENSFDGPSPGSSRFNSARQIICDLGLMNLDDNDVPQLSAYSGVILSELLEEN